MGTLTLGGVISRFAASLLLVLATVNPSGYSFAGWVARDFPKVGPLQVLVAIVLLAGWLFALHATWRSLGTLGVALGVAFFAALIWLMTNWGWLSLSNHGAIAWAVLVMMACLLTMGLCWALIQARISGQAVVEEVKR